ncbi:hypothetical protein BT96DRAFT_912132 [Gymnopus androsaceus JB14]|uniref:Uncharacterized protein n=1 Tax=Gymnopus androsaceus JB14 TaxID=1447944 RepID=A0A6A4IWD5_9AGAR|nr:hypothetical protein BT96DRAFT_912132 [Gymnopus androsaceus JB14]
MAFYRYLGVLSENEAKAAIDNYAVGLEDGFKAIYDASLQSNARSVQTNSSLSQSSSSTSASSTFSRRLSSSTSSSSMPLVNFHRKRRLSDASCSGLTKKLKNNEEDDLDYENWWLQQMSSTDDEDEQDVVGNDKSWSTSWMYPGVETVEHEGNEVQKGMNSSFFEEGPAFIGDDSFGEVVGQEKSFFAGEESVEESSFQCAGEDQGNEGSFIDAHVDEDEVGLYFPTLNYVSSIIYLSFIDDACTDASIRPLASFKLEGYSLAKVILSPAPSTAAVHSFQLGSPSFDISFSLVTVNDDSVDLEEEASVLEMLDASHEDLDIGDISTRAISSFSLEDSTLGNVVLSPTPSTGAVRSFRLAFDTDLESSIIDDDSTDVEDESVVLDLLYPIDDDLQVQPDLLDLASLLRPWYTREQMKTVVGKLIDTNYDSIVETLQNYSYD